jgi:hypothetical protein
MSEVTGKGLLSRMFPITVREIYNGTIVGEERVITLHTGAHRFGRRSDGGAPPSTAMCYCYNLAGRFVANTSIASRAGLFGVVVPASGACVLEDFEVRSDAM